MTKGKIKIEKSNFSEKFMDEQTYDLQEDYLRDYIENSLDMWIALYQIDRENTNTGDIYNEATKLNTRYKTPVELKVMYKIDRSTNSTYNSNISTGQYKKIGNLTFPVFQSQLNENDCDIEHGDIIAVPITSTEFEFFEVSDDGRANVDNLHSIMGYRKKVRSIVAVMTDPNKLEIYQD